MTLTLHQLQCRRFITIFISKDFDLQFNLFIYYFLVNRKNLESLIANPLHQLHEALP